MPREHERSPDYDHVPTPMMQGRPAERDPDGEDPLIVAARWTLQGGEPQPEPEEDED